MKRQISAKKDKPSLWNFPIWNCLSWEGVDGQSVNWWRNQCAYVTFPSVKEWSSHKSCGVLIRVMAKSTKKRLKRELVERQRRILNNIFVGDHYIGSLSQVLHHIAFQPACRTRNSRLGSRKQDIGSRFPLETVHHFCLGSETGKN